MSLLLLGVFFESDRPRNYQVDQSENPAVVGSWGCDRPDPKTHRNFRIFLFLRRALLQYC